MSLPPFSQTLFSYPVPWRRGRATSYSFELADRLADVDAAAWDRLSAGASFFLSRRYLQVLENNRPANLAPRYALVFRGRRAVAAVAAQRLDVRGPVRARLLICGNVFSWGLHGVALAGGEEPGRLWPSVLRALDELDKPGASDALVVKDFPSLSPLPVGASGLRPRETEPDMVLDLPACWRTFDDYLASLRTRYRRAALRVARQLSDAGCRIETLDDVPRHSRRLYDLFRQVHDTARLRLATPTASYLPALAVACSNDFRCSVIRCHGEIVGFVTTLRDGDTAVGYHVGFDREIGARTPLYVALLHAAVADALALGCRRLSLGRTALESKARLGARPRPLSVGWKGLGMKGRWLGKVASFRVGESPVRQPFKRPLIRPCRAVSSP